MPPSLDCDQLVIFRWKALMHIFWATSLRGNSVPTCCCFTRDRWRKCADVNPEWVEFVCVTVFLYSRRSGILCITHSAEKLKNASHQELMVRQVWQNVWETNLWFSVLLTLKRLRISSLNCCISMVEWLVVEVEVNHSGKRSQLEVRD